MPTGVLSDPHRRRDLDASSPICARSSRSRTRCRIRSTRCALPHQVFPGAEKPLSAGRSERQAQARLLSRHHRPLHGVPYAVRREGPRDFANSLGKGGREFPGPWGVSMSRNITSSKTTGIGDWTDAEIKRAITQGKSQGRQQAQGADGLPVLRQHDRRRPRRRHRLCADAAGEGVGRFPAPAQDAPVRECRRSGALHIAALRRGLYLGSPMLRPRAMSAIA